MTAKFDKMKEIPNDQYLCVKCKLVPEIIRIDYNNGVIVIKCPNHGEIKLQIDEYFNKEMPNLYYNYECYFSKLKQSDYFNKKIIFSKCFECEEKIFCHNCLKQHGHHRKVIKVNELNNKCGVHLKNFEKYCLNCRKHLCGDPDCKCNCKNQLAKIGPANYKDIETIKNKKKILIKNKELHDYLIKLLDTLIETYEKHPSNYYNSLNIKNVANNIVDSDNLFNKIIAKLDSLKNKDDIDILLNDKIVEEFKNFQKRIINYINDKLKVAINGKEKNLILQNKKIDDHLLSLLTMIKFDFLEELDLSKNDIENLDSLGNFKAKKLKKIDLSFNKINNIDSLKEIISKKVLSKVKEINLENNKLKAKEIEEIKSLLNKDENTIEFKMNYILKQSEKKVRLFGENFVKKNKELCKMQIENDDTKIEIKEELAHKDIKNEILKKGSINIRLFIDSKIEDMNSLFSGCDKLKKIDEIFNINSSEIKEIMEMFNGCSSLESLPDVISLWDTSKIKDMSGLFFGCLSLKSLPDIGKWNTGQLTDVTSMFRGCSHLESLPDLSNWDTSNVTKMRCMFYECSSLKNMPDLSKWNVSKVTDMGFMFYKCTSLKSISDLSNWNTSNVKSMKSMFKGCSSLSSKPTIQINKNNSTDVSEMFDLK